MSSHKDRISVPIVKDGRDICRLIFMKADEGRYDLKLDFLGNSFQVQSYRLFSHRPIVWDVAEPKNNMSYHYGRNKNPVLIHIKNENPTDGENQYTTLPIHRIQPPNVNQMFPLPLMKIEIPDTVVNQAKKYRPKTKYNAINIEDSNVIEVFMLPEGGLEQKLTGRYSGVFLAYTMGSIEFFASNTVLSDYQKRGNVIPHGEPATRGIGIKELQGMELYASVFPVPQVNEGRAKLTVTFIENELAEAIFLNGLIREKEDDSGVYFGGANYRQLDFQPSMKQVGLVKDSVAAWMAARDYLSPQEKEEICKRAIEGRIKLKSELKKYENEIMLEERRLKKAASSFMARLYRLQNLCLSKHFPHSGEDGYRVTDEDIWLMTNFLFHSEEIHILFSKYMGNEHYTMVRRLIQSKQYAPGPAHDKEYDSEGYEIKEFSQPSIHEVVFNHTWLEYNDRFDVDLLRGSLNLLLGEDGSEPACSVAKGLLTSNNDNWGGMKKRLLDHGFICSPVQVCHMDSKITVKWMSADNNLLARIYERIISEED